MTTKLFITYYPHQDNTTILKTFPKKSYHKVGEVYEFIEKQTGNHLFFKSLVSKKTVLVSELDDSISYLDRHCNSKTLIRIYTNLYKLELNHPIDVLIFTNTENYNPFLNYKKFKR